MYVSGVKHKSQVPISASWSHTMLYAVSPLRAGKKSPLRRDAQTKLLAPDRIGWSLDARLSVPMAPAASSRSREKPPPRRLLCKQLTLKPAIKPYTPPREFKLKPTHTVGKIDPTLMERILRDAKAWTKEVEELEKKPKAGKVVHTFFNQAEEDLGAILLAEAPRRGQIDGFIASWDSSGDGSLSKGELSP